MFNKKNKKIGILFGVLLLLCIIVLVRNNSQSTVNRNRNFDSDICAFDSSKVTSVIVTPKGGGEDVVLNRNAEEWTVTINSKQYQADKMTIKRMLETLSGIRATRVASRDKSAWEKFEVTDSAATRVQIMGGKKALADISIGKFSYKQPKGDNSNPYMRQQQGTLTSYVRLTDDKEVYAVDGMLSLTFNRNANDFRDHAIIRSEKDFWETITVTTPAESYMLKKQGLAWMVDGQVTDSASIEEYLTSITNVTSGDFVDEELFADQTPSHILSIESSDMSDPIEVSVFAQDTTGIVGINSSLNKSNYFNAKPRELMSKLFKERAYFSPSAIAESN